MINRKAAKALGLDLPPAARARGREKGDSGKATAIGLVQRFRGSNHINTIDDPRPEEARGSSPRAVSKDGCERNRANGHPSRRFGTGQMACAKPPQDEVCGFAWYRSDPIGFMESIH